MVYLYMGKSAAGKDTWSKREAKAGKKLLVSYTTRPIREGEVDDIDYHFVSKGKFDELFDKGVIVEQRCYHTQFEGVEADWYYGSPQLEEGVDYVGVATIDSAGSLIDIYGKENIALIYVIADNEIRRARAEKRGTFSDTEWERRLKADEIDFSDERIKALEKKYGKPIEILDNNCNLS